MKLKKIQLTNNNLLNWLLQGKDGSFQLPSYTSDMIVEHLLECINSYSYKKNNNKNVKKIKLEKFNPKDYIEHQNIISIYKYLTENKGFFANFLVHGSYSDLKIIKGWSDFDAIAVIKRSAFSINNRSRVLNVCNNLDTLMRKIDDHQHHGIHYIFEEELKSYPDLYLPHSILKNTKCLVNSTEIELNLVDSKKYQGARLQSIYKLLKTSSRTKILMHHSKDNTYLEEDFKNLKTMYQLKYFLCVVMLLPTLWLNSQGIYCKKSESFRLIKKYFTKKELELITCASLVRSKWNQSKTTQMEIDLIPTWVKDELGLNYLARGGKLAECLERKNTQ